MKPEWRALYLAVRDEKSRDKVIRRMVKSETHWMVTWNNFKDDTIQVATIPLDEWPIYEEPKEFCDGDSFFTYDEAFCQGGIIRFCEEWRKIKKLG